MYANKLFIDQSSEFITLLCNEKILGIENKSNSKIIQLLRVQVSWLFLFLCTSTSLLVVSFSVEKGNNNYMQ